MEKLVTEIETLVRERFFENEGSHDWCHIDRVRRLSLYIAKSEGGSRFVIELVALLHDVDDWKFGKTENLAEKWLKSLHAQPEIIEQVKTVIEEVSFKGAGVRTPCSSIESMIVQDADRLDAIGAIGIARAFAYGGSKKRPLHISNEKVVVHRSFEEYQKNESSTIQHFYEKLLLLKNRMNTQTAKQMAVTRHEIMLEFLENFFDEWNING